MSEITIEQLADLPESTYVLYDIRDSISYSYGTIPGAENLGDITEQVEKNLLPMDKKIILFCMHGTQSIIPSEDLQELGYDAYSLSGGYASWLRKQLIKKDRSEEIEEPLRKRRKFRERLFNPFYKAIMKYELIEPGDRIAVCISGGKDSMLMAKLFQQLQKTENYPLNWCFW